MGKSLSETTNQRTHNQPELTDWNIGMRAVEAINLDDGYSQIIKFDNGKVLYVDGNKMLTSTGKRVQFNLQFSDDFNVRQADPNDIAMIPDHIMSYFGWDERFGMIDDNP